jgi:broad specificity phosphatase PhoE
MKKPLTAVLLLLALAAASCSHRAPNPTVVFVVRHAEKAVGGDDPPLTEAGSRRAQALVQVAEDAHIGAIYSSQFTRNRETAKPLSDKTGVPVTEVSVNLQQPGDYGQMLAKQILAKHSGEYVVVVSHQNTIPGIVEGLSRRSVPGLKDAEYASLFIIVIPRDGAPTLIRAQYGQPDGM